jgi:hypothetical protein
VHSFGIEYHCIGIKTSNKKVQKKLNIASWQTHKYPI